VSEITLSHVGHFSQV